jgi:phage tail-like protein
MPRRDPYGGFRFLIELDKQVVASFSECSGLAAETEVEEVVEGGENHFHHKLPKSSKFGNLTLKHGLTDSPELLNWFQARAGGETFKGTGRRKSVDVILWDVVVGHEVWRWHFVDAYPVKWTGPELKAETAALAVESVELAHHGMSSGGPV